MKAKVAAQLAIFLANKPGTLAAVCGALANAGVNIYALSISDTVDHAVVRLVCSDARRALHIFEEHGTLVVDQDVLLIEVPNRPGSLAEVARRMAAHRVNIEYAYCATSPSVKTGLLVVRPSNLQRGLKALNGR
jgi:hypothetical protein